MSTHRIRLRGFWDAAPLPGGRVRHARRFGQPRTADPAETVWLVGAGFDGAVVFLNGEPLGAVDGSAFEFDVTARLRPRNELAVECGGPVGEVAVEIRPASRAP